MIVAGAVARLALRYPGLATASLSAAMLSAALVFHYLGDMRPCELCMAQRRCHAAALALGIASAATRGRLSRSLALASAAALGVGAGYAGYHVGVEQGLWAASCSAIGPTADTTVDLLASLSAKPAPKCDEVAWQALGLSMAAWNGIISAVGAAAAAVASMRGTALRP